MHETDADRRPLLCFGAPDRRTYPRCLIMKWQKKCRCVTGVENHFQLCCGTFCFRCLAFVYDI